MRHSSEELQCHITKNNDKCKFDATNNKCLFSIEWWVEYERVKSFVFNLRLNAGSDKNDNAKGGKLF